MNKGFTLIELLAVLVILSIISLIVMVLTTPTIKNSRQELSNIQISKIEDAAKVYYLKEGLGSFDYERNEHKMCVNLSYLLEKNYLDGSEIIDAQNNENMSGSVKITYKSNQYNYEYQDTTCSNIDLGIVCTAVTEATTGTIPSSTDGYVPGDEYMCEVKSGTSYKFYVLNEENGNVNLIMDRNIYYDATTDISSETTSTNKGYVSWYAADGDNSFGPVTAMDYLYNATKDWANIPDMIMNYKDEGNAEDYGYGTIITDTNGVTKITKKDGTAVTVLTDKEGYPNLKARMPIYSTDITKTEVANSNGSNEYLYENLSSGYWSGEGTQPTNNIDGIQGYWMLSSDASEHYGAWLMYYSGFVSANDVDSDSDYGVRPVISIPKSSILD